MTAPTLRPRKLLSLSDAVAALVEAAGHKISSTGLSQVNAFGEPALEELASTAHDKGGYAAVKRLLGRQLEAAEQWQALLRNVLNEIDALEARRARHGLYNRDWWDERRETLHREFSANPNRALVHWLETYAELLLAWEFELCSALVDESFVRPAELDDRLAPFRTGTRAIRDKSWPAALPMLTCLVESRRDGASKSALASATRAQLHILIGRIQLTQPDGDADAALASFQQASKLTPDDGRPDAAHGEYYLAQNDGEHALAAFQEAVIKSPALPDGYLGMGQYFEHQSLWDEAQEWYDKAIAAVWEEKDVLTALEKGHRAVSGDAWLRAARALLSEEPERALDAVERALDSGVKRKGGVGVAQELHGDILRVLQRPRDATRAYGEAARSFYRQKDDDAAIRLFEAANRLDPDDLETYWYWADSLLSQSYVEQAPYVDEPKIRESLRIWELGFAKGAPSAEGTDSSWAYTSRALINEQLARTSGEKSRALWWEAIAYLERALVLADEEPYRWAHLSRFHRNLENYAAALQAVRAALEADESNPSALDEKVAILANIGDFDAALEAIEQRLARAPNPWITGIKAFVMFHRGDYRTAIDLLDTTGRTGSLWERNLHATCYGRLGSMDEACKDFAWIWAQRDAPAYATDVDNRSFFASAAYHLALFKRQPELLTDAIGILLSLRDLTGQEVSVHLGLCYLASPEASNVERAERLLEEHIQRAAGLVDMLDLLNSDLPTFSEQMRNGPHAADISAVVERIRRKAMSRAAELERARPQSPEAEAEGAAEELRRILANKGRADAADDWAAIAALAGLARLSARAGRWADAAGFWRRLQDIERGRFPESKQALSWSLDELRAAADRLARNGEFAEARQQLAATLRSVDEAMPNDLERKGALYSRLGYVDFAVGNRSDSRMNFASALRDYRAAGVRDPGAKLGGDCRSLLGGVEGYWALDADWCAWREEPLSDELRRELAAACRELSGYLDETFQLEERFNDSLAPVVRPIVLEIGEGLIPSDTGPEWTLFKVFIPDMKKRVAEDMGVSLPGVRVRTAAGEPGNYRILLDEIPAAFGTVDVGMRYCTADPAALNILGVPDSGLVSAKHPLTGNAGAWVQPDYWKLIEAHGLELWAEPLEFIVRHLESVVRQNLADFVGIQETENMIESGKATERLLAQAVLPNQASRWRFALLLRSLVKDSVPLTPWEDVLRAASAANISINPLNQVIRSVRMQLRKRLPGNVPPTDHIELLPRSEEEELLRHGDGHATFALPPLKVLELLTTLRRRVDSSDRHTVLVTHQDLRVAVRRMVEAEFPYLMVIGRDELIDARGATDRA